jgi:hypothetical protein
MNSTISEQEYKEKLSIRSSKYNKDDIIIAICLLNFDDSIGQIAESIYPQDILDKLTIKQITGLGFPETNSILENGENKYIFKIRKSNST